MDSILMAVTGTFFAFLRTSADRSSVSGKGKIHEIDQSGLYRVSEKQNFKDLIKPSAGCHIVRRTELKLLKEVFYGNFFDRRGFFPFFIWLLGFFLWRMDGVGKILLIREPEAALEIVKSANTGCIANVKAGEDGVKMVFLEISRPFRIGSDPEFCGKQDGAEHVRRKPWGMAAGIIRFQ
ncbi:MAG: hypothetical protein Q4F41_10760 [Eubacteriales bacterium]|nr:hypothetical protein [Eubacteriales bacterium]